MAIMTPGYITQKNGEHINKIRYKKKERQNSFSGTTTRKSSDKNISLSISNNIHNNSFKPLKANQNEVAFKGLKVKSNTFRDLFPKEEQKTTKEILNFIGKSIQHDEKGDKFNLGFLSIEKFIKRNKLEDEQIYVAKKTSRSFVDSLVGTPKNLYRKIRTLFSNESAKKEIKFNKTKSKKQNQLLGYYLEVQKYGKQFDNAFKNKESLSELKGILKKDIEKEETQKEIGKFLDKNGISSKTLLGLENQRLKGFKDDVLKSGDKISKSLENRRKEYITDLLNHTDKKKIGSFIPNYSSDNAQLVNRVTSASITGAFVANDFYNLHMLTHDDKEGAKKERNKRFRERGTYVATTAYLSYLLNGTFRSAINASLPVAFGLGVVNSVLSNIASRSINKIPILPQKIEGMAEKPYVIEAAPIQATGLKGSTTEKANNSPSLISNKQSNTYKSFKGNPRQLAFSGAAENVSKEASKGIKEGLNNWLKKVDLNAAKALPAKVEYNEFKGAYDTFLKIGHKEYAKNMLRTVNEQSKKLGNGEIFTKEELKQLTPDHTHAEKVKKAMKDGKVIIGNNYTYRFGKAFIQGVKMPFELVINLGKKIVNSVKKMRGIEVPKKASSEGIKPEREIKNYIKFTQKATKEATEGKYSGDINKLNDKNVIEDIKEKLGDQFGGFHGPKVMSYGGDKLSNAMKLTGLVSVPFLAVDAYNKTAQETKNKNISNEKMRHRAIQDTTRQATSFWVVKTFNNLFRGLINSSLGGSAFVVTAQCASYEALTRKAVGQPITPRTHDQMKKIEKRRLSKHKNRPNKKFGAKVQTEDDKVILGSKQLIMAQMLNSNNNSFATKTTSTPKLAFKEFEKNIAPVFKTNNA